MRALGYIRVSTAEQAEEGAGLEAQRRAVADECERRGWQLVDVVDDPGYSGRSLKRPGVLEALERLERDEADVLVVSKLDRLSRSMIDFVGIMDRARREGWAVVALDLNVDTTTPAGEAMAHVLATFAQFERRLIGQRVKEALAVKRSEGVRLGRPRKLSAEVAERIRCEREAGATLQTIADGLTEDGITTAQGGRWQPSTVRYVLQYAAKDHETEMEAARVEWEEAEDVRKWEAGARADAGKASGWKYGKSSQCPGCRTFKADVGGTCKECGFLPGAGYVSVPASVSYLER